MTENMYLLSSEYADWNIWRHVYDQYLAELLIIPVNLYWHRKLSGCMGSLEGDIQSTVEPRSSGSHWRKSDMLWADLEGKLSIQKQSKQWHTKNYLKNRITGLGWKELLLII